MSRILNQNLIDKRFGLGIVKKKINPKFVGLSHNRPTYQTNWLLLCDCGKEYTATTSQLNAKIKRSCGCLKLLNQKNILGEKYGFLTVIRKVGVIGEKKRKAVMWEAVCDCGKKIIKNVFSLKHMISCGCKKNRFYENSNIHCSVEKFYQRLIRSAKERKLSFNISIEDILNQLNTQKNTCSISGLPISIENGSASLDRIDNDIGYEINNIQWLHRNVNLLKHSWQQDDFVKLCITIAQYQIKMNSQSAPVF